MTQTAQVEQVRVLKLTLHGQLVGYLAGFQGGRNPWRAIKPHLVDVMDKARTQWLQALDSLPMNPAHKRSLRIHWQTLQDDFQIK